MNNEKMLRDIIYSATSAKAHFDVWWTLVSDDTKPKLVESMNNHCDFFQAAIDAHYTACFISLGRMFDKRTDSSSLKNYLNFIELEADLINDIKLQEIKASFSSLVKRVDPLLSVRHKTVAHIDAKLREKDVFSPLNITWNEIRTVIYESCEMVEQIALVFIPQTSIGIPRDGRLREATIKLIQSIQKI